MLDSLFSIELSKAKSKFWQKIWFRENFGQKIGFVSKRENVIDDCKNEWNNFYGSVEK